MSTSNNLRIACARVLAACAVWLGVAQPIAADAPPNRYMFPMPGTVYDVRTKLTWQQTVDAGMHTQGEAIGYCTSLPLAGGGWRLPTRAELLTIVDPTKYDPALDRSAFPDAPKGGSPSSTSVWFWTATASAETQGWAWYVNFYGGSANILNVTGAYRVRCVR